MVSWVAPFDKSILSEYQEQYNGHHNCHLYEAANVEPFLCLCQMPPSSVKIAAFKVGTCRLAIKHRKQVPPRPEMIRRAQFLYLRVEFLPRQLPFKPSNPFLGRFFHRNYFRAAIRTRKAFFAIVEHLFPACLTSHFIIPFFTSFVLFVAKSLPSRARDETRIPLRRAAEDKLIRAKGFMGCSFRFAFL